MLIKLYGHYGATISTSDTVLVFGEILPKIIAKDKAEGYLYSWHRHHEVIMFLTPLNWVFGVWKKLVDRFSKISPEQVYTEG